MTDLKNSESGSLADLLKKKFSQMRNIFQVMRVFSILRMKWNNYKIFRKLIFKLHLNNFKTSCFKTLYFGFDFFFF